MTSGAARETSDDGLLMSCFINFRDLIGGCKAAYLNQHRFAYHDSRLRTLCNDLAQTLGIQRILV
jgi:hypothetical protein